MPMEIVIRHTTYLFSKLLFELMAFLPRSAQGMNVFRYAISVYIFILTSTFRLYYLATTKGPGWVPHSRF